MELIHIQYQRNDYDFKRGTFRVRGDIVDVYPPYWDDKAIRIEFFDDEIEKISEIDPLRSKVINKRNNVVFYPGTHYVIDPQVKLTAIEKIRIELRERLQFLRSIGKNLEAERLEQRTLFDLEMMESIGTCKGIENYSRYFDGRGPGQAPLTLIDYFPKDFLLVIDESHITVSQIGGMYRGDRARKETLVEHGFRLPSAFDNRPLNFQEFSRFMNKTIFVSATPGDFELEQTKGEVVEQIIRPTGLLDPVIEVRPASKQVEDFEKEIEKEIAKDRRVLVTTLTKRMSEDLSKYLTKKGFKVKYLHSDIETFERIEIIRDLRLGVFDVLVGINLLREGLDIPETALIGIFDADKEGFLRSARSLIQTIGRAARNSEGRVILYGDRITPSMQKAMDETARRRKIQAAHNEKHNITPTTISKKIHDSFRPGAAKQTQELADFAERFKNTAEIEKKILELNDKMKQSARELDFEGAVKYRDEVRRLKRILIS